MEPRLKWNKIILAAKIISFHFRRVPCNTKILWNNFILTWNQGFTDNVVDRYIWTSALKGCSTAYKIGRAQAVFLGIKWVQLMNIYVARVLCMT